MSRRLINKKKATCCWKYSEINVEEDAPDTAMRARLLANVVFANVLFKYGMGESLAVIEFPRRRRRRRRRRRTNIGCGLLIFVLYLLLSLSLSFPIHLRSLPTVCSSPRLHLNLSLLLPLLAIVMILFPSVPLSYCDHSSSSGSSSGSGA